MRIDDLFPPDDNGTFMLDDERDEFDDPFGEPEGVLSLVEVGRRERPEVVVARRAMRELGLFIYEVIGTTKSGNLYSVVRRKGEVRVGSIELRAKVWMFYPAYGVGLSALELDDICTFVEKLI